MSKWNVDTEQMMEFPVAVEADDALLACVEYVAKYQANVKPGPQRLFVAARQEDGNSGDPVIEVRCFVFAKADGERVVARGTDANPMQVVHHYLEAAE